MEMTMQSNNALLAVVAVAMLMAAFAALQDRTPTSAGGGADQAGTERSTDTYMGSRMATPAGPTADWQAAQPTATAQPAGTTSPEQDMQQPFGFMTETFGGAISGSASASATTGGSRDALLEETLTTVEEAAESVGAAVMEAAQELGAAAADAAGEAAQETGAVLMDTAENGGEAFGEAAQDAGEVLEETAAEAGDAITDTGAESGQPSVPAGQSSSTAGKQH
jgi:hypothetical protein